MYHQKIRNLEIALEEKNIKIAKLKSDPNVNNQELTSLVEQQSTILRDLSTLRRLQYDEDYERVKFDDDR